MPLYGFGAMICDIICNMFKNVESNYNIIWIFCIAVIVLSILEFTAGLFLDKIFHMKLWDYSKYFCNINGYICLQYSLMWGLLFLVYYYFIYASIDSISSAFINSNVNIFLLGLFYGIFIIDLSVSMGLTSNVIKYSKKIAESINLENLRDELKSTLEKRKFIYSILPYSTTNKYLKEKIKEK